MEKGKEKFQAFWEHQFWRDCFEPDKDNFEATYLAGLDEGLKRESPNQDIRKEIYDLSEEKIDLQRGIQSLEGEIKDIDEALIKLAFKAGESVIKEPKDPHNLLT